MAWQNYVARFLDLVYAIGFGVLAVMYPILSIKDDQMGIDGYVVTGYYGFFCLFFVGIILKISFIHTYCAFVNSLWIKSLFYIFCASLAFAQLDIWICDVVGGIFCVGAILNMIRCMGGSDDVEAAAVKK